MRSARRPGGQAAAPSARNHPAARPRDHSPDRCLRLPTRVRKTLWILLLGGPCVGRPTRASYLPLYTRNLSYRLRLNILIQWSVRRRQGSTIHRLRGAGTRASGKLRASTVPRRSTRFHTRCRSGSRPRKGRNRSGLCGGRVRRKLLSASPAYRCRRRRRKTSPRVSLRLARIRDGACDYEEWTGRRSKSGMRCYGRSRSSRQIWSWRKGRTPMLPVVCL